MTLLELSFLVVLGSCSVPEWLPSSVYHLYSVSGRTFVKSSGILSGIDGDWDSIFLNDNCPVNGNYLTFSVKISNCVNVQSSSFCGVMFGMADRRCSVLLNGQSKFLVF